MFVGWTEVLVLVVTLALVVAFATDVPFSKVDVVWTAPVRTVTDGEDVVCMEEVCETFAAAVLLESRVTKPS